MADQATVTRDEIQPESSSIGDVGDNFASVAADLVRLADLQLRMMVIDLRKSSVQTTTGVTLIVAGMLTIGGACAVGLAALGWALADAWSLSPGGGMALAAVAGAGLGVVVIYGGLRALKATLGIFRRSGTEFRRNFDGIKRSVAGSIN